MVAVRVTLAFFPGAASRSPNSAWRSEAGISSGASAMVTIPLSGSESEVKGPACPPRRTRERALPKSFALNSSRHDWSREKSRTLILISLMLRTEARRIADRDVFERNRGPEQEPLHEVKIRRADRDRHAQAVRE